MGHDVIIYRHPTTVGQIFSNTSYSPKLPLAKPLLIPGEATSAAYVVCVRDLDTALLFEVLRNSKYGDPLDTINTIYSLRLHGLNLPANISAIVCDKEEENFYKVSYSPEDSWGAAHFSFKTIVQGEIIYSTLPSQSIDILQDLVLMAVDREKVFELYSDLAGSAFDDRPALTARKACASEVAEQCWPGIPSSIILSALANAFAHIPMTNKF